MITYPSFLRAVLWSLPVCRSPSLTVGTEQQKTKGFTTSVRCQCFFLDSAVNDQPKLLKARFV